MNEIPAAQFVPPEDPLVLEIPAPLIEQLEDEHDPEALKRTLGDLAYRAVTERLKKRAREEDRAARREQEQK
jgi:hypothetical protein